MMTLESRITRLPLPFDAERGAEVVANMPELSGVLAELVTGAAGSSPHLADVFRREGPWVQSVLAGSPEDAFHNLLDEPVDNPSFDLRRKKTRAAGLIALADLAGVWSLEDVTGALTQLADHAVNQALNAALAREVQRGKIPGQGAEDIAEGCGLTVFAMGKMGAWELNFSSDIDLVCLFDETRFEPNDYAEARAGFIRVVRNMAKTLSDRTADGYVFRTDLRLRPDASVTPVALSMEAAERYYESFGRTWERAAFIKARPAAGDLAAGHRFLDAIKPFVWRRHLDYAAIRDAQDMRLRIRDHKGLTKPISHLGHDLKLGEGGIREIEFFTQTRQLISGGRDKDLRDRTTTGALARLAEKGWVSTDEATQLADDYRAHRETEHRVQMIADQQTHLLPDTPDDFARLAALSGREASDYAVEIENRLGRVAGLTQELLQPKAAASTAETKVPTNDILTRWSSFSALRSPRAVEILQRVWPRVEARLAAASSPKEALSHFEAFVAGLPAGVQLFSLFEANPQLLDLVVDIVDTAPELGQYLTRNASVFDAVIGGQFFEDWPGLEQLTSDLASVFAEAEDYENCLDRARLWMKEKHFRIGVHFLRGLIDAELAGKHYADLAGAVVAALWPVVVTEFSRKHGAPPGRGAAVVAMGSLGAGQLTAASDLDLIVIFDAEAIEASDGPRPLPTRTYFARLTQALVTAISAPTAEGRLYEVDMRLRPSGRQGPVATSLKAFKTYQTDEAWTWEHLALTRARPLAGDTGLTAEIEAFRIALIGGERDHEKTREDVATMRARLATAKAPQHWLDVGSGAGGLQDIDLLAQTGSLLNGAAARQLYDQIPSLIETAMLDQRKADVVLQAQRLFWTVRAASRLVFGPKPPVEIGTGAAAFLLRSTDMGDLKELETTLLATRQSVDDIVSRALIG